MRIGQEMARSSQQAPVSFKCPRSAGACRSRSTLSLLVLLSNHRWAGAVCTSWSCPLVRGQAVSTGHGLFTALVSAIWKAFQSDLNTSSLLSFPTHPFCPLPWTLCGLLLQGKCGLGQDALKLTQPLSDL